MKYLKLFENFATGPVIVFLSETGLLKIIHAYEPKWVGAWLKPCPYVKVPCHATALEFLRANWGCWARYPA